MRDIIIITGGSNGLGKAIAEYSLKNNLIVYNLDKENLELNDENYKCFIGDISDEEFVNISMDKISKEGNIKYLINNAGEPSFRMPSEYTKKDIEKCVKGMILC